MTSKSAPVSYTRGRVRADTRKLDQAQKSTDTSLTATREAIAVDVWSWFIEFPDNKDYDFIVNLPYAGSINSVTTISSTGTCTFTGKINTTALGGTANSVSTSESTQAHASANAFVAGDNFRGTVSSNSGCENMTVTVKVTRTI